MLKRESAGACANVNKPSTWGETQVAANSNEASENAQFCP